MNREGNLLEARWKHERWCCNGPCLCGVGCIVGGNKECRSSMIDDLGFPFDIE